MLRFEARLAPSADSAAPSPDLLTVSIGDTHFFAHKNPFEGAHQIHVFQIGAKHWVWADAPRAMDEGRAAKFWGWSHVYSFWALSDTHPADAVATPQPAPAAQVEDEAAAAVRQREAAAAEREREADAADAERRANDEREVSSVNVAFLVLVDDALFVFD